MATRPLTVLSHRRSGTHALMALLSRNLDVWPIKTHDPTMRCCDVLLRRREEPCLRSCHRYWRQPGESRLYHVRVPKRYGRWVEHGGTCEGCLDPRMIRDPVGYYREFYGRQEDSKILIDYETLVEYPCYVVRTVAEVFGLDMPKTVVTVPEPVGHYPRRPPWRT